MERSPNIFPINICKPPPSLIRDLQALLVVTMLTGCSGTGGPEPILTPTPQNSWTWGEILDMRDPSLTPEIDDIYADFIPWLTGNSQQIENLNLLSERIIPMNSERAMNFCRGHLGCLQGTTKENYYMPVAFDVDNITKTLIIVHEMMHGLSLHANNNDVYQVVVDPSKPGTCLIGKSLGAYKIDFSINEAGLIAEEYANLEVGIIGSNAHEIAPAIIALAYIIDKHNPTPEKLSEWMYSDNTIKFATRMAENPELRVELFNYMMPEQNYSDYINWLGKQWIAIGAASDEATSPSLAAIEAIEDMMYLGKMPLFPQYFRTDEDRDVLGKTPEDACEMLALDDRLFPYPYTQ